MTALPPVRKSVLASANWHVVMAGLALANAGLKDTEEIKLLKEVLRLLKARGPKQTEVK